MKKLILLIIMLLGLGMSQAFSQDQTQIYQNDQNIVYDAWKNYYFQYGNYFDKFFNQPRVRYYMPNQAEHEKTLHLMARYGVPYYNQYTGEYNGVQTATHIYNTSKSEREYFRRMEIWKR